MAEGGMWARAEQKSWGLSRSFQATSGLLLSVNRVSTIENSGFTVSCAAEACVLFLSSRVGFLTSHEARWSPSLGVRSPFLNGGLYSRAAGEDGRCVHSTWRTRRAYTRDCMSDMEMILR